MSLPFDIGSLALVELDDSRPASADAVSPAPHPARTLIADDRALLAASDDLELMRRIGAGDRIAFAFFCRRHGDRCHAVAMHLLRNAADAEEVVQDAMLRVWRYAERWRPSNAQVSTWLHRVVVNLCLDQMRRATRLSLSLDHAAEVVAGDPSPEYAVGQRELVRFVLRAATKLPPRQRAAIALIAGHGLDCAQAAAAMNVSVGTMESLLVRARRQLRAAIVQAVAAGAPKNS